VTSVDGLTGGTLRRQQAEGRAQLARLARGLETCGLQRAAAEVSAVVERAAAFATSGSDDDATAAAAAWCDAALRLTLVVERS
jgi:hypothetical protein